MLHDGGEFVLNFCVLLHPAARVLLKGYLLGVSEDGQISQGKFRFKNALDLLGRSPGTDAFCPALALIIHEDVPLVVLLADAHPISSPLLSPRSSRLLYYLRQLCPAPAVDATPATHRTPSSGSGSCYRHEPQARALSIDEATRVTCARRCTHTVGQTLCPSIPCQHSPANCVRSCPFTISVRSENIRFS